MKKTNKIVALTDYIENFTDYIASENYKLLINYSKTKTQDLSVKLLTSFIKSYIHLVVLEVFIQKPGMKLSKQEHFNYTSANFNQIKLLIQSAVAEGFNQAVLDFTSQNMDYYCIIKPMPEPINKEMC